MQQQIETRAAIEHAAVECFLNEIRATFGHGRWQVSQLLASPRMASPLERLRAARDWQRVSEQALGRYLVQLAANGHPLRRERRVQSYWVLAPMVENKSPRQFERAM